ncbi:MAG: GAF domain-containing protein [Anaerolineae bacterium]|nr:GAF domain-containing protein [Anaerolineae bacterium]
MSTIRNTRQNIRRTGTMRRRLIISAAALIGIPLIILTIASLISLSRQVDQQIFDELSALADVQANDLDLWVEETSEAIIATARSDSDIHDGMIWFLTSGAGIHRFASAEEVSAIIAEGVQQTIEQPFDDLMLMDNEGNVLWSIEPLLTGENFSAEPWFSDASDALLSSEISITAPGSIEPSLYFSTVVPDQLGVPIGYFVGRFSRQTFEEIAAQTGFWADTADYYFINDGQQYLLSPRFAPEETTAQDEIAPLAAAQNDGTAIWTDYRGEKVIGIYRWLPNLDMSLVLKQDYAEATASSRATRLQVIGASTLLVLVAVGLASLATRSFASNLTQTGETATLIAQGERGMRLPETPLEEVNRLYRAFNSILEQLDTLYASQEEMVKIRTRDLEMTAQMGHVIASQTEIDRLLETTIQLVLDQLGYYHVQVFLIDDLKQNAVLRASTGEAGQEMLARKHKLGVGSNSVVGQAALRGEPVLASDTRHAEFWAPNPLLPNTRAELGIPLRIGDQIIGVLDIQAVQPEVFDEATISILQTLADQLSVAIRNAELFEEREGLLSASLELTQMLTRDSWEDYTAQKKDGVGYKYDLTRTQPISDAEAALGEGAILLPIELRGTVIGELAAQLEEDRALSAEEQQLVTDVLGRAAMAIDNARLVEQTQRSLVETNRLYRATQDIAAANSVDELSDILIGLAAIDTVDRAFLFLLERPNQAPGERWGALTGKWMRDEADPLEDIPERLQTGQFPLLPHIEQIQQASFVINDVTGDPSAQSLNSQLQPFGILSYAVFPIIAPVAGRNVLGWLVMHGTRRAEAFTEDTIRFFETISGQAATALDGLRLFEQTQNRARRLQATNEISQAASSILNPEILLQLVVERVSDAFNYYHSQIFLIDEDRDWASLRASTGDVGKQLLEQGHKIRVGSRSVIGQVTSTGETVITRDAEDDPVHRRNELLPDTRSEMALPLKTGDRVIGALDVQSVLSDAFDTEAQAILQSLADQIAVTLENAQLFQEIQDRVAELTTVNLVSQTVSRAQTLDEVYDVAADQLMRQFGVEYAFLGVVDDDNMLNLPIFIQGGERRESPPPQPANKGLSGYVVSTGEVLMINEDAEKEARKYGARVLGATTKSILIVPMILADEVVGVLSIQDAENENAFDEAHVRQLTTLAAYISVKISNAELLEEAQRRANELSFLFDITRTAVATTDLDEALTNVAEILVQEVDGAEAALIYLANTQDDTIVFEAHAAVGYGRDVVARQATVNWGEGIVGLTAAQGQPTVIADAHQEPYRINGTNRTRSALVIPLFSGEEVIGVMTVESTHPNTFAKDSLQLLSGASSTLTAVIQNARLLEQITRVNEQLRELDKLKSQFLANMSHELRTPLNSIIGFSRVMLKGIDGPLNDLQTQDLTTIYNSGQHLLVLINNILDLSKIQADKMEIQPEYIGLDEIVDGVISTGRGLVKDRPVQIYKEVEDNLPQVYGDPVRIRQVLLNLVSNAAKFTNEGSITVRAVRKSYDPGTGQPPHVQVSVIDTGIGIAEEDMYKLFEAFSQVDGSTTRQVGGTGLGLTISKEFIEMHGGTIWVDSEVEVGSTFHFTIPLHPPDMAVTEIVMATEDAEDRPVVLAIDDEPGVLDLYARYLEKEGYAVVGLNNANDLLDYVRQMNPVAILLDINLPGKTGWDAIDDLKASQETRDIPIVVCSIDDDRDRGMGLGVAEYLIKPIIEDDLIKTLSRLMGEHVISFCSALIIEPDQALADSLAGALKETYDCKIHICHMGLDALQYIQEEPPEVVIMELDLPDMDGFGLLMSLRSQPELKSVPVIILSGRTLTDEMLERLDPENTHYLSKSGEQEVNVLFDNLSIVIQELGK